jgi:hypothetical protein
MSKIGNHIFSFLCAVVALTASAPPEVLNLVPPKYKQYAVAVPLVAMWLKGHMNLVSDPPK